MTPTTRPEPVAARPVTPLLYPILIIAGIAVIIACVLGIAAMTDLSPDAQSQAISVQPAAGNTASPASAVDAGAQR